MQKSISELIALAIRQEDALRTTIEAINMADKEALGRGPSNRLLGTMAYGHLSALRNCLGSADRAHNAPDFALAQSAELAGDSLVVRAPLEEGDAVMVQNGKVFRTTVARLGDSVSRYLFEKADKHAEALASGEYGLKSFISKYVGRFLRHLGYRGL